MLASPAIHPTDPRIGSNQTLPVDVFLDNARAETVATSRTYREPFKKRRCLVPASGFYEWKRLEPKNKQPFAFDLLNGHMMAFAGLWDAWKDPANGQWL